MSHLIELILYKAYADLKAESQRTYLGLLWWVLEPILFMGVFYVVFGVLIHQEVEHFVQFLLIGLIVWQWSRSTVTHGGGSILDGLHLAQRLPLKKILFPLVVMAMDTVKFSFVFVLLLVFIWVSGFPPQRTWLALPLLLVLQFFLTLGAMLILAALAPLLPDLRFVIDHILNAVFFLTGIFFPVAIIPEHLQPVFFLNPMAGLIESYRQVLLHQQWPEWSLLYPALGAGIVLCLVGIGLIRHLEFIYPRITE